MPAPSHPATVAALVHRASELLHRGHSLGAAALVLGVRKGTLWRWMHPAPTAARPRGRARKFALGADEANALRALSLKHGSFSFAVETFTHHPECSPATRALILQEMDRAARAQRRPRWPETLRAIILPRAEEEALLRGPRHAEHISHSPRKGMFYEDESGKQVPIRALDVWSMDDYSTNQPYLVDTADGPRLCRQVLAAHDLFSAAWLSVEMIGRERDAYRAEDIVRFILRTIEAQGTMPFCLMLERGRWDSEAVHGVPLDDLGSAFEGRTWGALDDLFHIEHGYSSRHKASLESSFSMLQTVLAHSGRDIGRERGEFEAAARALRSFKGRVLRASESGDGAAMERAGELARRAGFLTQDEGRAAHWRAMQLMNARSRERSAAEFEGRALVPNDLLQERGAARPLPAAERWRFSPVKRLATVRGGFIESEVNHYGAAFRFQVNGVSALHVPNGHRVLIAFDPATPALGCRVCNAEPVTREGWRVGDWLADAPHAEDAPQFRLHRRAAADGGKRQAAAAARTSFAGVNPHKLGMTHTQAHTGEGGAVIARTGAPAAGAPAVPPSRAPRGVVRAGLGGHEEDHPPARGSQPDPEAIAAARRRALAELEA